MVMLPARRQRRGAYSVPPRQDTGMAPDDLGAPKRVPGIAISVQMDEITPQALLELTEPRRGRLDVGPRVRHPFQPIRRVLQVHAALFGRAPLLRRRGRTED